MQNQFNLKITAFPRIHVTLIGMDSEGYIINGGIGFSISDPKIYSTYSLSKEFEIIDEREFALTINEKEKLVQRLKLIKSQYCMEYSFICVLEGNSRTHFGLGSTSAIYLSSIEALFLLNKKPYTQFLIQTISTRGGTSGIGIHSYFKGGCVFDTGVLRNNNSRLKPSSNFTNSQKLPLVLNHFNTPKWPIGVLFPTNIKNKSEDEEIEFFKKTCPIPNEDVKTILYEVVYGLIGSLLEPDYEDFGNHVNSIQNTKWKHEERSLYFPEILKIENVLVESGAKGIGMSSLGPSLYFTYDDYERIQKININKNFETVFTTMNNKPRIIYHA